MAALQGSVNGKAIQPVRCRPSSLRLRSIPRPKPIRSIEELIEHPERVTETPTTPSFHGALPEPDSPRTAEAKERVLSGLLSAVLEIYNGHEHWDSYVKELPDPESEDLPNPLFFDPDDRQVFVPPLPKPLKPRPSCRSASARPLSLQIFGPTQCSTTNGDDWKHDVPNRAPSKRLQDNIWRHSLCSPSKGSRIPSPVREAFELTPRKLVFGTPFPKTTTETTAQQPEALLPPSVERSPTIFDERLLPAKRHSRSPAAESPFASPSTSARESTVAASDHGVPASERNFAVPLRRPNERYKLPQLEKRIDGRPVITDFERRRGVFEAPKLRSGNATVNFKKVDLHGLERSRLITPLPFPRDMLKVSFTDMACEKWFQRGDIWIYCRTPKNPTRTHVFKELRVCKISNEGTVALEMAIGAQERLPPRHDGVPRKPLPPMSILIGGTSAGNDLSDDESTWERDDARSTASRNCEALSMSAANDSSKTLLRRVRDVTSLSRSTSIHAAGKKESMPVRTRGRRSTISPNTVLIEIRLLQDLERSVREHDYRFAGLSSHDAGSNIWKQIHILRNDDLLGTLWQMRQDCLEQWKHDKAKLPKWRN